MKYKLFIQCSTIILLCACNPNETHYARSYVLEYRTIDQISTESNKNGGISLGYPKYRLGFIGRFIDEGEKKRAFDEMCEKHNDVNYGREITLYHSNGGHIMGYHYIGDDFVSINIVSDADFDAAHKAGSSLNDLVRYLCISPKKFIDSGYTDTYNWANGKILSELFKKYYPEFKYFDSTLHPIDKQVSEIGSSDLILLGDGDLRYQYGTGELGYLHFEASPTLEKDHRITVTLTTDDGRELSDSVDITFE